MATPTRWWCGWCKYGPMSTSIDGCISCHRQRHMYAIYDYDTPTARPSPMTIATQGQGEHCDSNTGANPVSNQPRSDESSVPLPSSLSQADASRFNFYHSEPLNNSDGPKIFDIPRSSLGRRQNESLLRSAARTMPRRREKKATRATRLTIGEARKEDRALLEDIQQQSYCSIAYSHRSMGFDEADRRTGEIFCNVNSLEAISEYLISTEVEPARAGFLWATSDSLDNELHSGVFRHCLALRSAAFVVLQNFRRLVDGGLAGKRISFLILSQTESSTTNGVVDLTPLDPYILLSLTSMLTNLLSILIDGSQDPERAINGIRTCIETLSSCESDFPSLQIKYPDLSETVYSIPIVIREENGIRLPKLSSALEMGLKSYIEAGQAIVEVIDLAILTFATAHVGVFEAEPLSSAGEVISISRPAPNPSVVVRRLPLGCLSKMLGDQPVWVFSQDTEPSYYESLFFHTTIDDYEPLFLRTTIETFADVWGPVWSVSSNQDPRLIESYAAGGGSILPWRPDAYTNQFLTTGDRLCHWFSRDEALPTLPMLLFDIDNALKSRGNQDPSMDPSSSFRDSSSAFIDPEKLKPSDTLVIGAGSEPGLRWSRCNCSVDTFKYQLKEWSRMDHIIADSAYRFIDARQIGVVAGSHGLTAGMNFIYKDKKETSLKQSLLDRWEYEPQTRDPRELENFWGVAVSLCTMNARRVRVIDLLGVESVTNLLSAFTWKDQVWNPDEATPRSEMRDRYLKAVRSSNPYKLVDMWEQNPSWREELGNVLLVCLRILSKTGYDHHRDEFHILWTLPQFRGPRRVIIQAKDQSWIRFLRDTTDSMTMAVIVEDSLGHKSVCGQDRRQWFRVPSLLETSICVNSELKPFQRLKTKPASLDPYQWIWGDHCILWSKIWDTSRIHDGDIIWTGAQTRLKVLRIIGRWGLLLKWDDIKRERIRHIIGMKSSARISHWEYTNEDEEDGEIRPIPVHITSTEMPQMMDAILYW